MHSFDFRGGLGFTPRAEENPEKPTANRAQRRAAVKRRRSAAQTAARKGGK